jgi:hypothetical protein
MAEDDSCESRGIRVEVKLRQVMQYVDFVAANFDHVRRGKSARPSVCVIVAAHRSDRRDAAKYVQYRRLSDIAAMNDEVRVAKRIKRLRPNQAVGI